MGFCPLFSFGSPNAPLLILLQKKAAGKQKVSRLLFFLFVFFRTDSFQELSKTGNTRIRVRLFVLFQNLRPLLFRQLAQHDFIRAIRHFTHTIVRHPAASDPDPAQESLPAKTTPYSTIPCGVIPRCNRLIIPAEKLVKIRFPAKGKKYNRPCPVLSGGCENFPPTK